MSFFGEIWQNITVPIKSIGADIKIVTGTADKPKTNPSGSFMPHPASGGATGINTAKPDPYDYSWFLWLNKAQWQKSEEWLLRKMQLMLSEGKLTKGEYNSLIARRNELLKGEKYTLWEAVVDSTQSNIEAATKPTATAMNVGDVSSMIPAVLIALIAMVIIRLFK